MPSAHPKPHDTSISSDEDIPTFPAPPTSKETTQIPLQSPGNTMAGITQAQKQALTDNLQLESTRSYSIEVENSTDASG